MRLFVGAAVMTVLAGCGTSRCTKDSCGDEFICDLSRGICIDRPDSGLRDAGSSFDSGIVDAGVPFDAGVSSSDAGTGPCGTCSLATPICDEARGRCVRCTLDEGCTGGTPICDISFQAGLGRCERCVADGGGCGGATPICDTVNAQCVGCLRHTDCVSGICDLPHSTCFAALPDGGVAFDAGTIPPPDAGPRMCPNPRDAGVTQCVRECPQGFLCSGNECILNGGGADLQVTLRWDSTEDLDLHLDEPSDGGCEIWYGARSPACALGSLDLDSQAGCSMDLVLIENIIYPTDGGRPRPGTYAVRVDHFTTCSPIQWVPFMLEVRKGRTTMGMCGVFQTSDPDWNAHGAAGGGRPIMTFTYP